MGIKSKDLAKQLGVSTATMSLVLNNKPGISAELRNKLTEQIREMGYEYMLTKAPGTAGAAAPTAAQEKKTLAYVIYTTGSDEKDDSYNFFPAVLEGVETEAETRGLSVRVLHMSPSRCRSCTLSQCISPAETLGIVVQVDYLTDEIVDELEDIGLPFVVIDCYRWDRRVSAVCVNNEDGISNAIHFLAGLGHEKIGYVYSGRDTNSFIERRRCFHLAMRDQKLADPAHYKYRTGSRHCDAVAALMSQWDNNPDMPTALVVENDFLAWRTIKALQKLGYRIPQDISVVGFDDSPTASFIEPALTTLQTHRHLLGREAVIMLVNKSRLEKAGFKNIPSKLNVGVSFIQRESAGPVPGINKT